MPRVHARPAARAPARSASLGSESSASIADTLNAMVTEQRRTNTLLAALLIPVQAIVTCVQETQALLLQLLGAVMRIANLADRLHGALLAHSLALQHEAALELGGRCMHVSAVLAAWRLVLPLSLRRCARPAAAAGLGGLVRLLAFNLGVGAAPGSPGPWWWGWLEWPGAASCRAWALARFTAGALLLLAWTAGSLLHAGGSGGGSGKLTGAHGGGSSAALRLLAALAMALAPYGPYASPSAPPQQTAALWSPERWPLVQAGLTRVLLLAPLRAAACWLMGGSPLTWLLLQAAWAAALPGKLAASAERARKQEQQQQQLHARLGPQAADPGAAAATGAVVAATGPAVSQGRAHAPCASGCRDCAPPPVAAEWAGARAPEVPVALMWGVLLPCCLGVLPFMMAGVPTGLLLQLSAPALLLGAAAVALKALQHRQTRSGSGQGRGRGGVAAHSHYHHVHAPGGRAEGPAPARAVPAVAPALRRP